MEENVNLDKEKVLAKLMSKKLTHFMIVGDFHIPLEVPEVQNPNLLRLYLQLYQICHVKIQTSKFYINNL